MPLETLVVNVGPAGAASYSFTKQPADKLKYTFDYTEWLSDSEGVTVQSVVVTPFPNDAALGPPTVVSSTVSGTKVYVVINAGSDGYSGRITCVATMSDARVKEAEFTLYIASF